MLRNRKLKLPPFMLFEINAFFFFRDEASQVACLKIVLGLLSILSVEDIQALLPSVTDFSSNKSVICRELMFDILIWIYDAYR
jgi:hypothetical protein